jgi:thiol-disulfide isomerase/thioredoxin
MLGFLLSTILACVPPETQIDSAISVEGSSSSIYWDDCSYRIGNHICNLQLIDSLGQEFDLYENYGRPIIIDLSAEWCSVCRNVANQGEIFMEDWKDQDLLWVTILIENDQGLPPTATDISEWITIGNIENSTLLYGSRDLIDPTAMEGFPISGWPTYVILDKDLQIYHAFAGWSKEYMEQKLIEMLVIQ